MSTLRIPGVIVLWMATSVWAKTAAQAPPRAAKPVPSMQAVPLPDQQASIQWQGVEITRYHFGTHHARPFLFPLIGPSGRSLTRMGHPHDPEGHSHHNSVWISHNDVNGEVFWSDQGSGRIRHKRILRYIDGMQHAGIVSENEWTVRGSQPLLLERRRTTVEMLSDNDRLVILDLDFRPLQDTVTFGSTPFGLLGVRMAKSVGVTDGGGLIRNSQGQQGEQGPSGCFRKPARWCDYSGPIAADQIEGITILDHPQNVNHPAPFHVRDDGWMGPCLTLDQPISLPPGQSLVLRYGLYVHRGAPDVEHLDRVWRSLADRPIEPLE